MDKTTFWTRLFNWLPWRKPKKDMGTVLQTLAGEIACPMCKNLGCTARPQEFVTTMRLHTQDVQFIVEKLDRGDITLAQAIERLHALTGTKAGR